MHPAFSVIFFTVASGSGYGLLFLLGVVVLIDPHSVSRTQGLLALATGMLFAAAGLTSSMFHLGQPQRAWRAFTQWRSSWLSREGVAAVCSFVPAFALGLGLWIGEGETFLRIAGCTLAVLAVVTVGCTAQIYTSLKTIHAWHNNRVLPGYWLLALLGGATWWQLLQRVVDPTVALPRLMLGLLPIVAIASWLLKRAYWRFIDTTQHAATPATATGLGSFGRVRSGERPHTEANYLTNEMGFVLARKHAASLRSIAAFLFGVAPLFLGLLAAGIDARAPILAFLCVGVATVSVTVGLFVERWLFFAEAKHVVMLYYGADSA
jgi:sulfite dehydrogenase (quinone) subunit SoeC